MRENHDERLTKIFSKNAVFVEAFKCLFENASDAFYILNMKGNFVAVNRSAEELTGFKREDWIGKSFRKIIPVRYLPKAIRGFLDVIRGKSIKLELELKTAYKKPVLVEVTSKQLIIDEKIVGTLGIARDITERKKAEQALKESEEKYGKLFEEAMDAIFVADAETGVIVDCNSAALELVGKEKSELVGKHQRILHPHEINDGGFSSTFKQHLKEKEEGQVFEIQIITKKGKIREVAIKANVFELRGKKLIQGIFRDITERKLMQEKLKKYSVELEELVEKRTIQLKEAQEQLLKSERLAAIGELAAWVGHDLRNPLTGIAGATCYLKKYTKMDKKATEMLELIENAIECSDKIVSDLLEYSREIHLEPMETTPKSIIKEALALVKIPKNIRVLDLTEDKPKIKIDVEKMKRVFVNIIKNSVDAMPKGGKLAVRSKKIGSTLEIIFTDTGVGMPKDILEKIWKPLFTTKAKGMGFGLAICKRFVEAHGGNISVESTVWQRNNIHSNYSYRA